MNKTATQNQRSRRRHLKNLENKMHYTRLGKWAADWGGGE